VLSVANHPAVIRLTLIVGASARSGMQRAWVYAPAGYSPAAEEVISAVQLYVQEGGLKNMKRNFLTIIRTVAPAL